MAIKNKKGIIFNENNCTGCRICQLWCSFIHLNKFRASEAYIRIENEYGLVPRVSFSEKCTNCGQCAEHCLYGALELKMEAEQ